MDEIENIDIPTDLNEAQLKKVDKIIALLFDSESNYPSDFDIDHYELEIDTNLDGSIVFIKNYENDILALNKAGKLERYFFTPWGDGFLSELMDKAMKLELCYDLFEVVYNYMDDHQKQNACKVVFFDNDLNVEYCDLINYASAEDYVHDVITNNLDKDNANKIIGLLNSNIDDNILLAFVLFKNLTT